MTRLLDVGSLIVCIVGSCAGQELKVVKNAPFSATAVTQTVQTLADGNKITRMTTSLISRDTEGRTRHEQNPIVFIHDPVARTVWILDSRSRTARGVAVASTEATGTTQTSIGGNSLGSDVIAGMNVEGTRLTRDLVSGDAGNERSIRVTTEAWYSTELQTAVMTKTIDPRVGETLYQLTEVKRGEPDRSLFEIPADYSQQEGFTSSIASKSPPKDK
jgi:hypothetical protein